MDGHKACTPNMHLHLHIKECLYDFGPPYAFWCYAFERYNGLLGKFPTNQKNIEPQLMKKCLLLQELHSQSFPEEDEFCNNIIERSHTASGGLLLTMSGENVLEILKLSAPVLQAGIDYKVTSYEKCLPPIKHIVLDSRMTIMLQNLYVQLYPNMQFNCPINQFAKKALRASVGEVLFGSLATSRENNIVISAYWPTSGTNLQAGQTTRALPQAIGQIQYYIKHELISVSDGNKLVHIICICKLV